MKWEEAVKEDRITFVKEFVQSSHQHLEKKKKKKMELKEEDE